MPEPRALGNDMLDQVIQSLLASGPLAGVLGVAVWVLWKDNKAKERQINRLHTDQRKFFAQMANMEWEEEGNPDV